MASIEVLEVDERWSEVTLLVSGVEVVFRAIWRGNTFNRVELVSREKFLSSADFRQAQQKAYAILRQRLRRGKLRPPP